MELLDLARRLKPIVLGWFDEATMGVTPGSHALDPALGPHTGTLTLTYLDQSGAAAGEAPVWDGAAWTPTNVITAAEFDHGGLAGLGDDDHTQYLLADGTRALTGNWDAGGFEVRARTLQADVATGTAPLTVASTTLVTNFNADLLDGYHASDFALAGHNHDHGALTGLGDDDHPQYAGIAQAETITGLWTHAVNLVLDDGSGWSPMLQFVGGSNDDTVSWFLRDDATANDSDMVIRLCGADADAQLLIQSSTPAAVAYIDGAGNAWFAGNAAIGGGVNAAYHLRVEDSGLSFAGIDYVGFRNYHAKTGGASTVSDGFYGQWSRIDLDQAGGTIGTMVGIYGEAKLVAGNVGSAITSANLYGMRFVANLDGGTVYGDARATDFYVDVEAACTITGDLHVLKIWLDADGTVGGNTYLLNMQGVSNVDYGIYVTGVGGNYFQNEVSVGGTVVAVAQLHVDQSNGAGAKPVAFLDQGDTSQPCIELSSDGIDRDIHIFTVDVTGGPALDWDESEDALSWNQHIRLTLDGASIGQVAGPLLTFDDTNNYLQVSGGELHLHGYDIALFSDAGVSLTMQFNHDDDFATGPDILFTTGGAIAANDNVYLLIDADNGTTTAAFIIGKDAATDGYTEIMRVMEAGFVGLNETENVQMDVGVTINQAGYDTEIITVKSSDVAHGMTDVAETDTYGYFKKASSVGGGLNITGLTDADTLNNGAVNMWGYLGEAALTTKSAVGYGIINLLSLIKDGTGATTPGADQNLLAICASTDVKFIFDTEGEMHSDAVIGAGDDWDAWDDLALAADMSRLPRARWGDLVKYNVADFERAGLVTLSVDEDGTRHAFYKHRAMLDFHNCVFADVYQRLRRYEQVFESLGVSPALLEKVDGI